MLQYYYLIITEESSVMFLHMGIENGGTIGRVVKKEAVAEKPVVFGESHRPFAKGLVDAATKGQGHPMAEYTSMHWSVGDGEAHVVLFAPPVDDKPISAIIIVEDGTFRLEPSYSGSKAGFIGLDIQYEDSDKSQVPVMRSEVMLGGVKLTSESDFRGLESMGAGGLGMFGISWQTPEGEEIREVFLQQEHASSLEVSLVKNLSA